MLLIIRSFSTHHRAGKASGHKSKAQKQHEPSFPCDPGPRVAVAVGTQPCLLD